MKSPFAVSAQAALLAAALGLSVNGPHRAAAAPTLPITQTDTGVSVSILSPAPRATLGGDRPVEISAFYQGGGGNQITVLELYVDGNKAAQKILDAPETKGVVSFLVDASALTPGPHRVVVRATAADSEVASAKTSFTFQAPALSAAPAVEEAPAVTDRGANPPRLSIERPSADGSVQGTVTLRVHATDPSGKPPYVSLFIDRQFKTLRNYAPYDFQWDTSGLPNGYHTVEVYGYNDAQDVGHAEPLRLYVNNPGGRTERRTDLQDAPKTVRKAMPSAVKTVAPPRRPALLAKAKPVSRHQMHRAQMAQVMTLARPNLTFTEMPGLSSPFLEADAPTTKLSATVRVLRSGPSLQGFKPMVKAPSEALLAVGPAVSHVRSAVPLLKSDVPVTDTLSRFMAAPSLPKLAVQKVTATVRTVSSVQAAHPRLLVSLHTPMAAKRVAVQMPLLSQHLNWIRAAGQTVLTFNSNRLALVRPLAAQGGVMFGPLRQIFQQNGGSLMWQARTGVITAHTGTRDVSLTVGQKTATVNNEAVALDAAPYINKGRTMVPLAFLKAAMNVDVQYDPATGRLSITSKD